MGVGVWVCVWWAGSGEAVCVGVCVCGGGRVAGWPWAMGREAAIHAKRSQLPLVLG